MYNLERIKRDLEKLDKELSEQIQALDIDKKKDNDRLRDDMLKISSTYQDQVLVLRFITFVNDKLETKQQLFSEIVSDTLKELIKNKQELVLEFMNYESSIKGKKKNIDFLEFFIEKVKLINEIKSVIIFGSIFITILILSYRAIFLGEEVTLEDVKESTEKISNSLDIESIATKIMEKSEK